MNSKPQIAVIGAGPAGLGVISSLDTSKVDVLVLEKSDAVGGHLNRWSALNPTFTDARDVIARMANGMERGGIKMKQNAEVTGVDIIENYKYRLHSGKETFDADAVVFAGGFQLFDARQKEELGYGIYPRVVTSADLEKMLHGSMPFPDGVGETPTVGVVHCVGSRDVKCGNLYCSRICCMVGVKQAIELKRRFAGARVSCFYMDLRMAGRGYEELYQQAQVEYGVQFIRGRVSEVSENNNGQLSVKAEDTLLGRPLRGTFDLLVLMVGMEPASGNPLAELIPVAADGFAKETFMGTDVSVKPGLFWAGACKGPVASADAFRDGQSAGIEAMVYLERNGNQ